MTTLWTEKYRPKFPIAQGHPHLLLHGPPSTGKTTYAHQIAQPPVLELNASNDRGIQAIRSLKNVNNHTIILDECDQLTVDAQQCLRRIIETSSNKFIFIANYLCKIILPLKSRLYKIKFENRGMLVRLKDIAQLEKLDVNVERIYKGCGMDVRKSLNIMQALAAILKNNSDAADELDKDSLIDDFLGVIPAKTISDFELLTFGGLKGFVTDFMNCSYSLVQFIIQIVDRDLPIEFYKVIGEVEEMCIRGGDTELLLYFLCSSYIKTRHCSQHLC
ncbi:hypothetical protein VCUG_01081 [Vavraia culicis subsp. floridensis]|uniref:ATPase AAA-type core domain-containing protein n=1 Tax=Vavraia culicis (isolate floridensis) TaxID=948595 RepID=L2GWH1_VAVCU|nr:uncharacterized protein VCUG_01081 [Vavraia culicis subsp. floridensis]ELA47430.1 hypothetical protein VCUG_01081 [Vavraia culicis subsp. floridensis]